MGNAEYMGKPPAKKQIQTTSVDKRKS